jgi:hypothetical protein
MSLRTNVSERCLKNPASKEPCKMTICRRQQPLEKEFLCWKKIKGVKIFISQGNKFSNVNSYTLSHATTPSSRLGRSKKPVLQVLSSGSSLGSHVLPGSDKVYVNNVNKCSKNSYKIYDFVVHNLHVRGRYTVIGCKFVNRVKKILPRIVTSLIGSHTSKFESVRLIFVG